MGVHVIKLRTAFVVLALASACHKAPDEGVTTGYNWNQTYDQYMLDHNNVIRLVVIDTTIIADGSKCNLVELTKLLKEMSKEVPKPIILLDCIKSSDNLCDKYVKISIENSFTCAKSKCFMIDRKSVDYRQDKIQ